MSTLATKPPFVDLQHERDMISFRVTSATDCLVSAVDVCRDFLLECGVADCSGPAVVFRELIVNAMVHGNRACPSRFVSVKLERLGTGRFRFSVQDEGRGFNPQRLEIAPARHTHGQIHRRGYMLVAALTERIEFNETGNRVSVCFQA